MVVDSVGLVVRSGVVVDSVGLVVRSGVVVDSVGLVASLFGSEEESSVNPVVSMKTVVVASRLEFGFVARSRVVVGWVGWAVSVEASFGSEEVDPCVAPVDSGTFASTSRLEVAATVRPVLVVGWMASVVAEEGRTSDSSVRLWSKASYPSVPLAPNSCPVCRSVVSSVERDPIWAVEISKGSPETAVGVRESGDDVTPWVMGSDSGIAVPGS